MNKNNYEYWDLATASYAAGEYLAIGDLVQDKRGNIFTLDNELLNTLLKQPLRKCKEMIRSLTLLGRAG
jgi:hypothetical protein